MDFLDYSRGSIFGLYGMLCGSHGNDSELCGNDFELRGILFEDCGNDFELCEMFFEFYGCDFELCRMFFGKSGNDYEFCNRKGRVYSINCVSPNKPLALYIVGFTLS